MNVPGAEQRVIYDRQLLLRAKRNALLELWEVQQYGIDSFGDPDYVSDVEALAAVTGARL